MLKSLIPLCVLTIGLCYATPSCHDLQKSQLASLSDRITQMLSTLYTPPQSAAASLESAPNATPPNELPGVPTPYETTYYPYQPGYAIPAPQVIYVSPTPGTPYPFSYAPPPKPNVALAAAQSPYHNLEAHVQPVDPYRGYPAVAPKPPLPPYDYSYAQQYAPSPPAPYGPTYTSPYPYSWDYSPYPEYRMPPTYSPKVYSIPAPSPPPTSYPPHPGYLSPVPFFPPPYYPNQPELPPPPYYP